MKDEAGTKKQLIDELNSLRLKVSKLEESKNKLRLKASELRKDQERFAMLSIATNDAIHDWDLVKNKLWCNEAMQKTLGVEEFIDDPWNWWIQVTHPDDRRRMVSSMERLLKSNRELGSNEYRIQIAGATPIYINHRIYILRDRKGKPVRMIGAATNITERKQVEEALRESEERYRAFFKASRDCTFVTSVEGRWVDMNDAAVELFGYSSKEELKEVPIRDLYADPEGREGFIAQISKNGYVKEYPVDLRRKDGSIIHVLLTSVVWNDADGNVLGYLGTTRDVTDKRRIENELNTKHEELKAAYGQLSAYDEELRQKYTELLESQQSLHESETRYRAMFQHMGSGVAVYETPDDGETFIFNDFNRAGEEIENIKKEELIGRSVTDVFPGVKEFGILDVFRRVWRTGVSERYPVSLYKKGELPSWRDNFVYKLPTGEIVAIYDDVTKSKKAEEALRQSEEKYRTIIENMGEGYIEVDLKGRLTFFNEAAREIIGYSKDETTGMHYKKYADEENAQKLLKLYSQVYRTGIPQKLFEWEIIRRGGTRRTVEGSAYLIKDAEGRPIGFRGLFRDTTERKRAEEALRKSEEQYRSLAHTGDSIYIVDVEQRYLFMNEGHLKRFGMPLEQIVGRPYGDFHSKEDSEKFAQAVKTVFETGASIQRDHKSERDGRFFIRTFSPVVGHSNEVRAVTIVAKDITDRKQAEEALRNRENELRSIFRAAPIGIGMVIDRVFQEANDSLCLMSGYSREELLGQGARMIYPTEEDFEYVGREKYRQIGEKGSGAVETRWLCKDGTIIDVLLSSTPLDLADLKKGVTFAALDITDRKRAEEALRESETKLQAIFDTVGTGILMIDRNTQIILEANQTAIEMIGLPRERIIGQICHSLVCPAQAGKCPVKDLGQDVDHSERKLLCADGHSKDILKTVYPITIKGRDCYLENFIDITERKLAEHLLRESEKRYREMTDFLPIAIFELDATGNISSFNRIALEVFRYNQEDYKEGMNALQFFPPEEWQRVGENMERVFQGASIPGQEYTFLRKDGSTFIGLIYASPSFHQNKIVGMRGAIVDITDRKLAEGERRQLEERLQRAEKMEALGTLAGGVAHDLNNVLGVLVGYSELLLQNVPQDSPFQRHATQIFKGSQRAAAIIQDLLTLTRRGVLVSETLNLNRIISDFLQMPEFEAIKAHHPGVQFKTSLDAELLHIKGSSTHLNKTVMNLLSNAAESISGLGEVSIRTENRYVDRPIHGYDTTQEGEYAVLTVSDTGSGISPADLGRIFEPFYTKKVMGRSGTGLGLAVVWGTVKDHDGYIDVQSTEGKGSVFTLYFPVTREALTKFEQAVPRDTYLGRGEHILVVDDVEGQRLLASAMLDSLGYKVSTVSSGEEAVEFVKKQPVDLLILDMIMDPGIDGLETYRRILEIHKDQKAIIVSGFAITERVRKIQELGAGSYVRKPYLLEKIGTAVRTELDK